MCGIVGLFSAEVVGGCDLAQRLLSLLAHRGEPAFQMELASGPGWTLGTNRLAILSSAVWRQPVRSPDGSITLAFNGEVYNCLSLSKDRCALELYRRGAGDGVFVAAALAEKGISVISDFDGMFAFLAIDHVRHEVFAGRDRIGIKPLYYAWLDDLLVFASEIKALAPEDRIREIHEVLPGETISLEGVGSHHYLRLKRRSYFDLAAVPEGPNIDGLGDALKHSVKAQCQYDAPIGVYLSGGVDSSGVYALAKTFAARVLPLVLGRGESSDTKAALRLVSELGDTPVVGHCPDEEVLLKAHPKPSRYWRVLSPILFGKDQSSSTSLILLLMPD